MAAALGCWVPAVSAQVVIHPEWLVAYAFPMTTEAPTLGAAEPLAAFDRPAPAFNEAAFAAGPQLTALFAPREISCRGDAAECPGFLACFALRGPGGTFFPED